MHSLPTNNIPARGAHLLQSMYLHWHIFIIQGPIVKLEFTLDVVHFMGSDKCIMTSLNIIHTIVSLLQNSSIPPTFPDNHWLFIVSIVLPFPEYYIVEITQYTAFSYWLLSLGNMHLSFLHVFSWLNSSFLFSAENISLSECSTNYPFTYSVAFKFRQLWIKLL